MPRYSSPGVYVDETTAGAPAVTFPSSLYALLGECGSGVEQPVMAGSEAAFTAALPDAGQDLRVAVRGFFLNGGSVVHAAPLADFTPEALETALARLDAYLPRRKPLALAAPGLADPDLLARLVQWCERRRTGFAILDGTREFDAATYDPRARIGRSNRAALYQPWLLVREPDGNLREVPPAGFVMGLYARTESTLGIFKHPANMPVSGIVEPAVHISAPQQGLLNPRSVNAIRSFSGRGTLVWGARTLIDGSELQYVGTARLVTSLIAGVEQFLERLVFERSEPALWKTVEAALAEALTDLWREGALTGSTPSQAFYTACGLGRTMTQNDIDSGSLICEIGLAPLRPAEFVTLRFRQALAA